MSSGDIGDGTKLLPEVKDLTIDQKVILFREKVVAQKGKVDAQKMLRQYFTAGEMSNLWGKLKRHINGSSVQESTKKHWSDICSKQMRYAKTELQNQGLVLAARIPT